MNVAELRAPSAPTALAPREAIAVGPVSFRTIAASLTIVATSSCGGAPPPPPITPEPPARTATADSGIRTLVLDMASRSACDKIRGKLIGLPGPPRSPQRETAAAPSGTPPSPTSASADEGLSDVAGRWLVRDCEQATDGNALTLKMGGPGWQWVDRLEGGFHIQQHVFFQAKVELKGTLDVGYDPSARVASIWLTPAGLTSAQVVAAGTVTPRAEGAFASVKATIAPLVGINPSDVARSKVGSEGAKQFQESLSKGATITYSADTGQMDLLLGALPNGVVPKRPFSAPTWLLNEYQLLQPGGFQLAGPFPPMKRGHVEALVEEGSGVRFATLCARDGDKLVDSLLRGDPAGLSPYPTAGTAPRGQKTTLDIAPPPCTWLLATETAGADATRAAIELVGPPAADSASGSVSGDSQASGTSSAGSTDTPGAAWVKVTVVHFKFEQRKLDGTPWDPFGGAPDPQISVGTRTTPPAIVLAARQDVFESDASAVSPLYEVTATDELLITASDIDSVGGDPMGTGALSLAQIVGAKADVDVALRIGASVIGTVRLRIERAARP